MAALALGAGAATSWGQRDFYELAPIKYSERESSDAMARLGQAWESGRAMRPQGTPREILRSLLQQLGIPEESQVLVFSRTSKQGNLIRYTNPRALYFSQDDYVGYVPGGQIEVAATDAVLGPVFYLLDLRLVGTPEFVQRDNSCLQCHGTSRTELVPGLMVRSVFPDENGHPILAAGTYVTTAASPLRERWGGWFVTGSHGSFRHMGNTIASLHTVGRETNFDYEAGANWESLEGRIALANYLRPTSDIVALMVLEHQCHTQNLLTKAGMEYQRLAHLQRAIDPEADVSDPEGMTARAVKDSAEDLARALLFCDEFDLGEGVEGDPAFAKAFEARGKRSAEGDSLRDLRLYGRLFKNRCSYLIHSKAFGSLPSAVRDATLVRIWEALHGEEEDFAHIEQSERDRIVAIVRETVADLPVCWE